jgi:hypothetical protein
MGARYTFLTNYIRENGDRVIEKMSLASIKKYALRIKVLIRESHLVFITQLLSSTARSENHGYHSGYRSA